MSRPPPTVSSPFFVGGEDMGRGAQMLHLTGQWVAERGRIGELSKCPLLFKNAPVSNSATRQLTRDRERAAEASPQRRHHSHLIGKLKEKLCKIKNFFPLKVSNCRGFEGKKTQIISSWRCGTMLGLKVALLVSLASVALAQGK